MNVVSCLLGMPFLAAAVFISVPSYRVACMLNTVATCLTFIISLGLLGADHVATEFFLVDDFNIYLLILTAFVMFTTSVFSAGYIVKEVESAHLQPRFVRYYHAMFQGFLFSMLLALSTNNLGVMWVALEGATLTTVMLIGLYRTPAALEASWKYFILCGVGIALALFGTTLLYLAAEAAVGPGMSSLTWSVLLPRAADFNPALLNIAFVFLFIGYGTKAGLVPLHAWLPDAHAEGPTPISAVLSGLLLNVAIYAILRIKMLLSGNAHALVAGPIMIVFGLASVTLAAFMLYRRTDIKRLFAYSSIEHMGIITLAFGIGGPMANFAGLLHMAMHSLTKAGIFFVVGLIAQVKGTQKISEIRGLTSSHPALGWALVIGVVAIAGLPPFGLFTSEFLLITSTFTRNPLVIGLLVLALLVGFCALLAKLQIMAFGSAPKGKTLGSTALLPFYLHMGLVLAAGIYLPRALVSCFHNVAKLLG